MECLPTPTRKIQRSSSPVSELFADLDESGVDSLSIGTPSDSVGSSNEYEYDIPGNVEEVCTSATPVHKRPKLKEEPLPDPFPLPQNYRPDVEVALKNKTMTVGTRKAFLSQVAASIFTRKRYPKREELIRVALDLIRKYPFLASKGSKSKDSKTVCSMY